MFCKMSRFFIYLVMVILAFVLQFGIANTISIYDVKPDFILIVLCLIAAIESRSVATFLGFLSGLMVDSLSPGYFGYMAFAKCLAVFVASTLFGKITINKTYEVVGITFVVAILHNLIYTFLVNVGSSSVLKTLLTFAIPSAFYSLVIAAIFFSFLPGYFWRRITGKKTTHGV
jgi:rod shape-determining protein MreD